MTPQEISDYKRMWLMASYHPYKTHTDLRTECIDWCKANCQQQQWDIKRFTDIYGDTIRFELQMHYKAFDAWYKERWR